MNSLKTQLRREAKARLERLTPAERLERSERVVSRIIESVFWIKARRIGLFASRWDEPELSSLWSRGALAEKRVYYPRIDGDELNFLPVNELTALVQGRWRLLEPPLPENVGLDVKLDLILVPGLAFDREGGRLGRGKGFYDRYLTRHLGKKAGVCFDFQIVEKVPTESQDVAMDLLFSDAEEPL